jgi:hypothetical protein
VDGADGELFFSGDFIFVFWGMGGFVEMCMPRCFVSRGFGSGVAADSFEILKAEGAMRMEEIGFGFGCGGLVLIDEPRFSGKITLGICAGRSCIVKFLVWTCFVCFWGREGKDCA